MGRPPRQAKEKERRTPADPGWQKFASVVVDKRALEMLFADLDNASRTLLLSQSGEGASCVLTCERCGELHLHHSSVVDEPHPDHNSVVPGI